MESGDVRTAMPQETTTTGSFINFLVILFDVIIVADPAATIYNHNRNAKKKLIVCHIRWPHENPVHGVLSHDKIT